MRRLVRTILSEERTVWTAREQRSVWEAAAGTRMAWRSGTKVRGRVQEWVKMRMWTKRAR